MYVLFRVFYTSEEKLSYKWKPLLVTGALRIVCKAKKKKLSRHRHAGTKEERWCSSSFLTVALYGVVSFTPRPHFTPGKDPLIPIG
jgi:hypothetical protein